MIFDKLENNMLPWHCCLPIRLMGTSVPVETFLWHFFSGMTLYLQIIQEHVNLWHYYVKM